MTKNTWYEFRQNNSGGSFDFDADRGISVHVIVQADDAEEANYRANRIGLYFDGCETGDDCECCGDRWYRQSYTDKGDPVPSEYGVPLIDVAPDPRYSSLGRGWMGEKPECFVHLKDGRFFGFVKVDGRYVYAGDPEDLVEALPSAYKEIES